MIETHRLCWEKRYWNRFEKQVGLGVTEETVLGSEKDRLRVGEKKTVLEKSKKTVSVG